jgi:hypothetical protein
MRFRCARCKGLTEFEVPAASSETLSVPCGSCGLRHRIVIRRPRSAPRPSPHNRAASPGVVEPRAAPAPGRPAVAPAGPWTTMVYVVAALIMLGLGMHLIHLRGKSSGEPPQTLLRPAEAAAPSRPDGQPSGSPAPPPPLTVPTTDATGQVVAVDGPDPESVLIAFCGAGRRAGRSEPIGIATSVPPNNYLRFGVFRDLDRPDSPPRAIRIHRDPRTGRWSAGDGRRPVPTEPPPEQPE